MNEPALGGRAVRALSPADRSSVVTILRSRQEFREDELTVALELFDEGSGTSADGSGDPDYRWVGVECSGDLVGCACYGPTPSSDGTFDLYWIVVRAASGGAGFGRLLLQSVEERVAREGGRLLVIETSGADAFAGARAFYLASGYSVRATIRDFYAPGEDRLIFASPIARRPLASSPPVA